MSPPPDRVVRVDAAVEPCEQRCHDSSQDFHGEPLRGATPSAPPPPTPRAPPPLVIKHLGRDHALSVVCRRTVQCVIVPNVGRAARTALRKDRPHVTMNEREQRGTAQVYADRLLGERSRRPAMTTTPAWRALPPAHSVRVPGRGEFFVREVAGPPGAPALVLLHGVTMTADLNWFGVFDLLGRHFRVIAPDLQGHGRGPSVGCGGFQLDGCTDDVAALVRAMGVRRVIPVGYSMGGLVAQLLWRRHPDVVEGLVLCSTARNFRGSPVERLSAIALPGVVTAARFNPFLHLVGSSLLGSAFLEQLADPAMARWACSEMERTSLATALSVLQEVSQFSSHTWIGDLDVPTSVVITGRDRIVPASRQRRLAAAIPHAAVYEVDAEHGVCVNAPLRYAATLLAACRSVIEKSAVALPAGA